MAFTLKIEFQGLIGYVPTNGGKSLLALFVEGRKGRQTSDGHHIPAHVPVIQFARRNVADPGTLRNHEQGKQKVLYFGQQDMGAVDDLAGLWFLDNQDIELRYEGQDREDQKLRIWDEETRASFGQPNGRGPASFFSQLPHLDTIISSASRVDPDCLLPQPREGLLAARFTIREGVIESLTPPEELDGKLLSTQFRPIGTDLGGTVFTQTSIGSGALVEVKVPGDSVTLVSRLFGDEASKSVLKLAPVAGQTTPIHVKVRNLPLYDIFGLPNFEHPNLTEDRHFEIFYELSLRRPPLHKRPIPHFELAEQNGGGHVHPGPIHLSTPWCPPAVFQS
ncbi:MAG TPA: hypothetical protein VF789_21775 [Thermoanaerobaculia bacterium]